MKRGHRIRSDLIPDSEQQPGYKIRANKQSFGVYRPVMPESIDALHSVLVAARDDIDDYLTKRRKESSRMVVQKEMGVTYVQKGKVERAMRKGMLQNGFDLGHVQKGISNYNETQPESIEVGIDLNRFDWFTFHNRKLVGKFVECEATELLAEDTETVGSLLEKAHAPKLPVQEPDHLSFIKYGTNGDHRDLSSAHRRGVLDIVRKTFEQSEVDSIWLGQMVVGRTYSDPIAMVA